MAARARSAVAKAKAPVSIAQPECLHLTYRLAELPSTQHRAGLAGLVLLVRWLERNAFSGICTLTALEEHGVILDVDLPGLRRLLDELYGATKEDQPDSKIRKDKKGKPILPLREETREVKDAAGKVKKKTFYIYPAVVPKAAYLADRDTASGGRGLWVKLWRDMVWNTLRGVPATRKPFEARADQRNTQDADDLWKQLAHAPDAAVDLPSTYFLGAMESTADNVSFKDRARFQFLLHFWPYAAQVYVPQEVEVDETGKARAKLSNGFALAIPDVSKLASFCDGLHQVLADRKPEAQGYRPREAVIDVPAESALDLAYRLAQRIGRKEGGHVTSSLVLGYEVFHLAREGNNIRILSTSRLVPDQPMLDEYTTWRRQLWDPHFRRRILINLVSQQPQYTGFDRLLRATPYAQTIGSATFRHDARLTLHENSEDSMQSDSQVEIPSEEQLVYQLVRHYVLQRLKSKHDLEWEKVKGDEKKEADYNQKRSKIAKDAFLAVRSRTRAEDFISYFAGTLCSATYHMNKERFAVLARALHDRTQEIRTFTLLALCANG
ncbi:type I-MYXAN CRISPR-associated protein Cmx8 [Hyalangium versicolor]|uniref:type I-MYXAN CRISPR-associated protein Cmx8 n=1 Tax=Hyalangium versicolor TaxID=2861190 RepID=UPI001CCDDCCC|nr:type I-MYXAN CRISPR-associated protein Cmx8 [Hyalangium versicolor]